MSAIDDLIARDSGASAPQGVDALIARDAGSATVPASAAGGAGAAAVPAAAGQPAGQNGLAQDLAAGGADPDLLNQMWSATKAGAHGVGSMFNNAANFVERNLPFFPADIAARDTAIQAAADQQFAQNASPGEKAAAIVAPMLLPMSGAMAPGKALSAGIARLAGNTAPTVGKVVGNVAGNAVNGGILATGAPIDPNQSAGSQDLAHLATGAVLGSVLPGAYGAAKWVGSNVYNAARPILNPQAYVGQQFASQLGDQAADVANGIRNAPQYVPGSMPTTAQAAPNATLVATEKAAANGIPGFKVAQAEREAANNQARWDALGSVAGTEDDLKNAIAARGAATNTLYNVAKQQNFPVDAPMTSLMARPAMQSAIDRAQKLANNTNAGPILQTTRVPNSMGGSATNVQTLTGNGAQAVKEALDAMLLPENTQKLSTKEIGALQDTRAAYMSWLESKSPEFTQARQTYSGMSPPINTMQAAQAMQQRLGGLGRALNTSGAPQITAPGYATALAQALKAQEFGIDPSAQAALENIGSDLQRSTVSNSLRSPGADTAYNIGANGWLARNLYGPAFGGASGIGKAIGALGAAATGHPMIGLGILGGGNKVGQVVGGRLNGQLSNFLLNPNELLPYLDAQGAAPVNGTQQALAAALRRNLLPAVVGGVTRGGLVNAGN